jgi:hypothetical protein
MGGRNGSERVAGINRNGWPEWVGIGNITLNGKKGNRIYAKKADGDFEAHLIALSCSDPPEGFSRWSMRLLADKVVELDYIDSVSHETIRQVLKKTKLNLGAKKVG